jgi:hypothetical protein
MKIGLFGYTGDHLDRTQALCTALKSAGAEKLVCLGGLVWSGSKEDEEITPGTVLRWLRQQNIDTLANDSDRQVAGWRLQALLHTTGFIRPRVRKFLANITREEAQWIYSRPSSLPVGKVLCCTDQLTMDAMHPVPLTRFNATRLFSVMEQRVALFPSAHGPGLIVRRQDDGVIEATPYANIDERLDSPRTAALIGGIAGLPPHHKDVCWGAVVDGEATLISLVCLDAKTLKKIPERARLLLQRASTPVWKE